MCTVVQAVNHRPVTAEARVDPRLVQEIFLADGVTPGFFPFPPSSPPVPRFPPVSIIPPMLLTYLHYQKDERVKNLEKIETVRFRISGRI
jgi:hypothetical protein